MENKKLNELKEQIKSEENKCLILGIVVSVVLFLITKSYISIFGGIIFSIILSSVSLSSLRHEYQSEFKRIFVENTLKEYFTDLVYDSNKGLDENILSSTGMIYTGDKYQSNDFASGKYKDVNFMQADVKIDELHVTRDDKGHTKAYYVTLFLGKWMIFDFNKEFKANFQVVEKNFSVSKIGDSVFKNSKFEKVEMEGIKFNEEFTIYAENAHDVYYILTPQIIEKLHELNEKIDGELYFGFINNKLYIGVDTGSDSFEAPDVYDKVTDEEVYKKIKKEISLITMFVDTLELDNGIFRKVV